MRTAADSRARRLPERLLWRGLASIRSLQTQPRGVLVDKSALISTADEVFPRVPLDVAWPAWGGRLGQDKPQQYVWMEPAARKAKEAHPLVAERDRLGFPKSGNESVALIDWSAVHNVCTLLEAPERILDPFTAALDLSTVVAALVFYDRVVCLDYGDVAARLSSHLRLDQDVVGIRPSGGIFHTPIGVAGLIERYFYEAQVEFERAEDGGEKWLASLVAQWESLLPVVTFPAHDYFAFTNLHGTPYDGYEDTGNVHLARDNLFELTGTTYQFRGDLRFEDLVLDNDRRSLFYEFLLEQLREHWNPDRTKSFRYLATCLRTPMKLARADWAAEQLASLSPTPEDWLQTEWHKLLVPVAGTIRMPFWLGAVLAGSRSREDFASELTRLREAAKRFRRRRSQLEDALFAGNVVHLAKLQAALGGDLQKLTDHASTRASSGLEVVDTAFTALTPVPFGPKSAAALVSSVDPGWFKERWLKLFQPQVWFVYALGRQGQRVTNVLPVLFERFQIPRGLAEEPLRFMEGLGAASAPV
jgi:hypothetical protein